MSLLVVSALVLTCLESVETSFAGVGTAADFVGANFTPHMLTVNAGEV